DTYEFEVISGGSLPDNGEPVVVSWKSDMGAGTFELEGNDPPNPDMPLTAEVDGMTLYFYEGTLSQGDVFYLPTDDNGVPGEVETQSDWHWTLSSYADEFNRSAGGVTASVSADHSLVFDTNPNHHALESISFSGADGFNGDNVSLEVVNQTAMDTPAQDMQFARQDGNWVILNDPTGGKATIIPEGGDDDGFMVDMDGDGLGDIQVDFKRPVTGDGAVHMDMVHQDPDDIQYGFTESENGDSGLMAALGINTFYTGTDAESMGVNSTMADGDFIASGRIDPETGERVAGDNSNALAMSNVRYEELDMKKWHFSRDNSPTSTVTASGLDEYEQSLVAGIGLKSQNVQSAQTYSNAMTYQLTGMRDSISAVSLDEEMVNLTAHQQAYLAASKLLTTVDEMLSALLSIR
ncbi:MAG: hypothetical protein MI747_10020, partial [Desulfobacterales bacterium]|nr:hypothetical protein [Desulfobacterales bacterium]